MSICFLFKDVHDYDLTLHDNTLVNGEQTSVQPVQYQDDGNYMYILSIIIKIHFFNSEVQMIHAESTGVQPGDNQVPQETMSMFNKAIFFNIIKF